MKPLTLVFVALVFASSITRASPPSQWLEDDWAKFIDAAAWGSLGDAYSKAGGNFPLVDVYSALSASAGATKPGLQLWLRRKISEAYAVGDHARGDRYNAPGFVPQ